MTRLRQTPIPAGPLGLLSAILADTPRLAGAACRRHPDLFAATVVKGQGSRPASLTAAREQARAICRKCPALGQCESWVRSTPEARRPAGIVAGQLATHPSLKSPATQLNPKEETR